MSKEDPQRAERLAEALRANLRRRKARQREEAIASPAKPPEDGDA